MSRAYRVRVEETLRKIVRAEDHVSCQLELLEILPCEQMSQLLAAELSKLGFTIDGDTATRQEQDVTITVDLPSATVVVQAASDKELDLKSAKVARVYDDRQLAATTEGMLRKEAQQELAAMGQHAESLLQRQVTDQLEAKLGDIRKELESAANRATAAALKQRAAQLGHIKSISEDPEAGSLTIVVEV